MVNGLIYSNDDDDDYDGAMDMAWNPVANNLIDDYNQMDNVSEH